MCSSGRWKTVQAAMGRESRWVARVMAGHLRPRHARGVGVRDHSISGRLQGGAPPTSKKEEKAMNGSTFPPGWDEARVRRVLDHYEAQSEEEAVAEDEAAYESTTETMMAVPVELVPRVRELIASHQPE
jgi:hypothetical protein